ncbi:MAG: hypothetical protein KJO76_03900 [Gammaproteobacteria bacterium]|nr:hypothetical protein [Gammaproteobacteria bacterium]NND37292.1 hypothetical protein [Gammaproteobacteria bacterium]
MKNRLLIALTGLFSPVLASAMNGISVLEMYPYVMGRDFPWEVPLIGLVVLGFYLFRTVAAYREIEGH